MPNELEEYATQVEEAAQRTLTLRFNPLAFTMEEVNQMMADGWDPLPPSMWFLPEERRLAQIEAGERKPKPARSPGCIGCGHDYCDGWCLQ